MPKYRGCGIIAGSKYLGEVEAANAEEAKEKFLVFADVSLCRQCVDECEDPEVQEVFVELVEGE